MSRGRRERRTEQGQRGEWFTGYYGTMAYGPSLLGILGEDKGLYPGALSYHKAWTWVNVGDQRLESFLFDAAELVAFISYVCPRLQERRELQRTTERLREERERLRQQVATLEAEKEGLRATLKMSEASALARGVSVGVLQQEVAEATAESERLLSCSSTDGLTTKA